MSEVPLYRVAYGSTLHNAGTGQTPVFQKGPLAASLLAQESRHPQGPSSVERKRKMEREREREREREQRSRQGQTEGFAARSFHASATSHTSTRQQHTPPTEGPSRVIPGSFLERWVPSWNPFCEHLSPEVDIFFSKIEFDRGSKDLKDPLVCYPPPGE